MTSLETAQSYLRAGLSVLPAIPAEKRPAVSSWKPYQDRLPTEAEIARWFASAEALCLICGAVSGNLEMIDFDLAGEAFEPWYEKIEGADLGLLKRLVIEHSPSGGWHVAYRCEEPISGNLKLAQRKVIVDGAEEVTIAGKKYRPRQDADGNWHVILTLIETRGKGGLFLCAPTPGYELFQGEFNKLPVLKSAERELLLEAAWSLNEYTPEPVDQPTSSSDPPGDRPGDDFNARGDVRAVLRRHGWTLVKGGDNEYWRRPEKTSGWSATLKDKLFYVFSTSAAPFEAEKPYSPFAVHALLEHNGDYAAAASALRHDGFGQETTEHDDVDTTTLLNKLASKPDAPGKNKDELRFAAVTSKELDENAYDLTYLIDGVLVRGQPGVIAGPKKTLKTNIAIDLALSLSHGGLFLGRFNVSEAVRVGLMSGESGAATIQETARRIADAKCWRLADFDNAIWSFDVPQLNIARHIDALRRFITEHELEVLILDPTYLMMMAVGSDASNLFVVGGLLKSLGELAQETGCTPLLCHHLKKGVVEPYQPAELEDIAWAGFQEFVRQWILLNRRAKYDPDRGGYHELWMSCGGSAGHSGLWALNIEEGTRQDAGGRRWNVEMYSASEAYAERDYAREEAKEQKKQRQQDQRDTQGRDAILGVLAQFPGGETKNILRDLAGLGGTRFARIFDQLAAEGLVEQCDVIKQNRQAYPGYRLTRTLGRTRTSECPSEPHTLTRTGPIYRPASE